MSKEHAVGSVGSRLFVISRSLLCRCVSDGKLIGGRRFAKGYF